MCEGSNLGSEYFSVGISVWRLSTGFWCGSAVGIPVWHNFSIDRLIRSISCTLFWVPFASRNYGSYAMDPAFAAPIAVGVPRLHGAPLVSSLYGVSLVLGLYFAPCTSRPWCQVALRTLGARFSYCSPWKLGLCAVYVYQPMYTEKCARCH